MHDCSEFAHNVAVTGRTRALFQKSIEKNVLEVGCYFCVLATLRYGLKVFLGSYCHRLTPYDSKRWLGYPQKGLRTNKSLS